MKIFISRLPSSTTYNELWADLNEKCKIGIFRRKPTINGIDLFNYHHKLCAIVTVHDRQHGLLLLQKIKKYYIAHEYMTRTATDQRFKIIGEKSEDRRIDELKPVYNIKSTGYKNCNRILN